MYCRLDLGDDATYFVYLFLLFISTAPILGNFTEEETNGSLVPHDTLEYPLQRDEVQTLNTKGDRNHQTPQSKQFVL